jgi:divinyl protochlorophyllide a 8-vinyl-reductase
MRRVGLSHYVDKDPSSLIAEAEAMRLFTGVRAALSQAEADALLGVAGVATGRYILAHRIPAPARALLKCLPAPLAAPLLMKAIAAHAWTFAGSGKVVKRTRPRLTIEIEANPLATPGCPWHLGVLETLFRALVSPTARVRHDACCAEGQRSCRSSISL